MAHTAQSTADELCQSNTSTTSKMELQATDTTPLHWPGTTKCTQAQTGNLCVTGSLAPSGKADRVVFKVNVELEKLEARLQYESSSAPPLALLSVEAVAVDLTVRPDTLTATASLGNLRAQDGVLPEVCTPNNAVSKYLGPSLWLVLCSQMNNFHVCICAANMGGNFNCSWMSPVCVTYSSANCSVASRLVLYT